MGLWVSQPVPGETLRRSSQARFVLQMGDSAPSARLCQQGWAHPSPLARHVSLSHPRPMENRWLFPNSNYCQSASPPTTRGGNQPEASTAWNEFKRPGGAEQTQSCAPQNQTGTHEERKHDPVPVDNTHVPGPSSWRGGGAEGGPTCRRSQGGGCSARPAPAPPAARRPPGETGSRACNGRGAPPGRPRPRPHRGPCPVPSSPR